MTSQIFSIRVHAFDSVVRNCFGLHPDVTVVTLAEGLQTSCWRLRHPTTTRIIVDLPPIIDRREQLLPCEQSVINAALSALDRGRMELVPTEPAPIITAEGLFIFIYFDEITNGAALPWSLHITTDKAAMVGNLMARGSGDTLGCRLMVDTVVKAERISNEVHPYTFCVVKSA